MRTFLLVALSVFTLAAQAEEKKEEKKTALDILNILKEKNIISPAEYSNYKEEMAGTAEMNAARAAADTTKVFRPRIEFHGMGHFAYSYNDAPQLEVNNSFEMIRAAIYGGAYLTRNIDFFTLYYFQPDAIQRVHELFGRWRVIPEFGVRVGLMKNPLTFENNVSSLVLQTIDYAQSISALTGLGSDVICLDQGPSSGRDLGAEVFGSLFKVNDHRLLDYRLGVFNGAGIQYLRDNNNHKDISGSLTLQPIKGNHISGGFYIGEGHYRKKGAAEFGDYKRNRWTLGLLHDSKRFYGRAEYIRGIDDKIKRHGFYALGIYHPLPQIDITLVYDWYNDNLDVTDTGVYIPAGAPSWCDVSKTKGKAVSMKYSIGGTYRFTKRIRVQAFYTFTQNDAQTFYTANTNKAIVQLELGF